MTDAPADAKWPRLLSLSVHELRTPISVVAGYLRMVLKDPAGTLDERYRRMLEEAEKSCGRLATLVAEMSDLSAMEAGTASLKRGPVDLRALLTEAIAGLPNLPDRTVDVELTTGTGPGIVQGDGPRLRTALTSVFQGLRREVVQSEKLLVNERYGAFQANPASWIAIAEPEHIDAVIASGEERLTTFDEWRGGCGLSLSVARRIIDAHDGRIWSAAEGIRTAAVIMLRH